MGNDKAKKKQWQNYTQQLPSPLIDPMNHKGGDMQHGGGNMHHRGSYIGSVSTIGQKLYFRRLFY